MKQWWSKGVCRIPPRSTALKFLRFMAAGVPGLAIAVPLNLLLVQVVGLPKALAYPLVLIVQVSVNFFTCLLFVFDRDKNKSLLSQYLRFTGVVGVARGLDWALYVVLTSLVGLNYIFVQVMNAAVFGIGKFVLTRRVLEQQGVSERGIEPLASPEKTQWCEPGGCRIRSAIKVIRSVWERQWMRVIHTHLWVLGLFCGLTFVMVYLPISIDLARTYIGHGEVVFWSNYFWWFDYAIRNSLNPLVHSYILYPLGLPMTDGVLPFFLFIPITRFFGSIVSYNLYVLFTFAISGYGMYLLANFLLKDSRAAFLAGTVFAFFPFHFGAAAGHLHTYSIMWVPFAVLWLCKLYENPSLKNALWLGVFFALNALTSSTVAVMLVLFILVFAIIWFRQTLSLRLLRNMAVAIFLAAALVAPFLYRLVSEVISNIHMAKPLQSFVEYSADILGFIVPSPIHPVLGSAANEVYSTFTSNYSENITFMGYSVILLFCVGALLWWKQKYGKTMILASLIFFVLSLGPVLHVMGVWKFTNMELTVMLPGVLTHYIPILDMIRVPSRYVIMLMFCVAIVAGYGWRYVLQKYEAGGQRRLRYGMLLTAVVVSLVLFEYSAVVWTQNAVAVPETYSYIKDENRSGSIIEVPLCLLGAPTGGDGPTMIRYYEYQKTHERPIWGGYWSRSTPDYVDFLTRDPVLSSFLLHGYEDIVEPGVVDVLSYLNEEYNVGYVIVHKALLSEERLQSIISFLGDGYIEDTSSPGDPLLVYETHVAPHPTARIDTHIKSILFGDGWHNLEQWDGIPARWMSSEATLIVTPDESRTVELSFTARSLLTDRTLEVFVGGRLQGSMIIPNSPTVTTFTIFFEEGENVVLFRSLEGADRPCDIPEIGTGDCRELSFGIQHISVQ